MVVSTVISVIFGPIILKRNRGGWRGYFGCDSRLSIKILYLGGFFLTKTKNTFFRYLPNSEVAASCRLHLVGNCWPSLGAALLSRFHRHEAENDCPPWTSKSSLLTACGRRRSKHRVGVEVVYLIGRRQYGFYPVRHCLDFVGRWFQSHPFRVEPWRWDGCLYLDVAEHDCSSSFSCARSCWTKGRQTLG